MGRKACGFVVCVLVVVLVAPAAAQVEDQLSAYTGQNATGYLQPLADAFGASLNDGFFHSAYIPKSGFKASLEIKVMGVIFADEDRFFRATTESGFQPQTEADAPTIVGPGEATIVPGAGGTQYAFPGGLDLNSFGLAVPQLRLYGIMGTEALIRYIAFNTGDAELGDLSLYGFGLRHSISQYLGAGGQEFPVDLAAGFMWQSFTVGENDAGDDLLSSDAFTIGVQASKRFGFGLLAAEPFTGLSIDTFGMTLDYESDVTGSQLEVEFDNETSLHWTVGLGFNFLIGYVHGEYHVASQNSFSFGLALGNVGL